MARPETSIIIRTLNEEKHLGNLLGAIAQQSYRDFEVIVVDSGSVDRTLQIAKEHKASVVHIESHDFTFGYSLNVGCQKSRGKYLVFASAHVLPTSNEWLGNLIAPFKDERVAMVYGRQFGDEGAKFSEKRDFLRLFSDSPFNSKAILNYANNANAAARKDLWEQHPFDEYLFGLEDIEWARYMIDAGYLINYEPKAAIYHIHREKWHQVFNRYRREAIAAMRIGLPHPPQAQLDFLSLLRNVFLDLFTALPKLSLALIEEILRFRYYQWKGSRQGWYHDKDLDLDREKYNLFFPSTNKVVNIPGIRRAELVEVPLPEMKPGDVLVRVEYTGICHTDLEVYEGTLGYYQDGTARYPIVPGHEFSGTIVKIGAHNKTRERLKVGDRVVGECILSRGSVRKEVGVINYNGAYSQFVVMPGAYLHPIPEGVDFRIAALTEPLSVVLRALRRLEGRLKQSSSIAVIGAGPIGNLCAQVLAKEGHAVSVFDQNQSRLNILKDKVVSVSRSLRDLDVFDVVIDATGSKEVLRKVLHESHRDSTVLLLGFPYGAFNYNFEEVVAADKVIIGSVGADGRDFWKAVNLIGELDTRAFIKTIVPLSEFKKGWEMHKSAKQLKILLKP